jgi:hypothetical protein
MTMTMTMRSSRASGALAAGRQFKTSLGCRPIPEMA